MKIAIDLRSLHTGRLSGVENYILHVVEYLVSNDTKNTYTLFYNSFKPVNVEHFHFVNSKVVATRFPNKILNAALWLFNFPIFEKLIGDFDVLFLPNLNPFALGKGKKLALTIHDLSPIVTPEFYGLKDRIWHKVLRIPWVIKRADIIFTVSEFTKQDVVKKFGVDPAKVKVAYPGLDPKIFRQDLSADRLRNVRNNYSLPGKYILFVNTLEPRKNLNGLLEAFENLESPEHLVIAGKPGFNHKETLKKIKQSKKQRFIHYLGYIEESDKPYIMAQARALIYPSFYEGFGFQPLEAMALGVPVLASQIASLPEVCGDAALLINPYNTADIASGIKQILSDQELRGQLISKGLEKVKQFKWQTTAQTILEGLQALS